MSTNGVSAFSIRESLDWRIGRDRVPNRGSPAGVALHLVKMACELPYLRGRSLSQWDCTELARQLEAEGVVDRISAQSVRRMLHSYRLKPWRHHLWLSPQTPRDAAFADAVRTLSDLYSRPLEAYEVVAVRG